MTYMTDPVWWSLALVTFGCLYGVFLYIFSIIARINGNYEDAYMAALLLSLSFGYHYLWDARGSMYSSPEIYSFIISRTNYIPPVAIIVICLYALLIHKTIDVFKKTRRK
jgi:hypothetical protein